jgi:hypothetical protein
MIIKIKFQSSMDIFSWNISNTLRVVINPSIFSFFYLFTYLFSLSIHSFIYLFNYHINLFISNVYTFIRTFIINLFIPKVYTSYLQISVTGLVHRLLIRMPYKTSELFPDSKLTSDVRFLKWFPLSIRVSLLNIQIQNNKITMHLKLFTNISLKILAFHFNNFLPFCKNDWIPLYVIKIPNTEFYQIKLKKSFTFCFVTCHRDFWSVPNLRRYVNDKSACMNCFVGSNYWRRSYRSAYFIWQYLRGAINVKK